MAKIAKMTKGVQIVKNFLPFIAILIPNIILYFLDPFSFEKTWKGRTYYLFFLWVIFLETILKLEGSIETKVRSLRSLRGVIFVTAFLMPTIYIVAGNYFRLNIIIDELAIKNNIEFATQFPGIIPLSIEYLVFTVLFALIVVLEYGIVGLEKFSVSTFLLGIIGMIYMMDNLYGRGFTPFQILVPTTATLASKMLNFIGYKTALDLSSSVPILSAWNQNGFFEARIGWPCAGIDSLLIYSVILILFLGSISIFKIKKVICFLVGAAITYFVNILRIVTIFVIGIMDHSPNKTELWRFHDYYGPLYSITWIMSYILIIMAIQTLRIKLRERKLNSKSFKC